MRLDIFRGPLSVCYNDPDMDHNYNDICHLYYVALFINESGGPFDNYFPGTFPRSKGALSLSSLTFIN